MRTMIVRKSEFLAGNDSRVAFGVLAEAGKTLRKRATGAKPENKRTAGKGAAGYQDLIAHRQKS